MLGLVPLMVLPLVLYNLGLVGPFGAAAGQPWTNELFSVSMMSGGVWSMTLGDAMVVVALAMLFIEVVKATRTSNASIVDHLLSTLVLIVFIVEFLLVQGAATSLFFTLTIVSLVDVLAGFSVSLRGARRDLSVGGDG